MDTTPLVSVLVPIYNVEKYLEQCLESARVQTLADIEVICINDGSTDSSPQIIRAFMDRDPRFRIVDKPNSGYGDSMNKGLEAARGKYISILESDDFLDPEALEHMVGLAEAHDLEVVKCNFWLYWSTPARERAWRNNIYFAFAGPDMIALGPHAPRDYPSAFFGKFSIWSALYRKDFLDRNNIRFLPTPGASYQDSSFTFKVFAAATRLAYSGRAFLHYRQDNEGSSVNSKGKVFCVCDEHAEMSRYLNEERPDLKAALDPIRAKMKFLNYRWNYDRLSDELKKEFLPRFADELRREVSEGALDLDLSGGSFFDVRVRYLEQWEADEISELTSDPAYYAAHRSCEHSSGKLTTLERYWKAGGFSFVQRALSGRH